jgi:virginiamycin B lyase
MVLVAGAQAETISGTVKDASGAPVRGAFVKARSDAKSKITISVLSDGQGRYRIENVSPGGYQVQATAIGYRNDSPVEVAVAAGRGAAHDFALPAGTVRWSDLTVYQGKKLLPEGKGKEILFGECYICHGFQSRMAAVPRDANGWLRAVNFMRAAMHPRLASSLTNEEAAEITAYLNSTFGVDSKLPKSPADMPGFKDTVRTLSDESLQIVYVDYDLPGPNRMPFSGTPDKDGKIWIPEFGRANRIARLDPGTGEVQEFVTPHQGTAGIHAAYPGPDGKVWFTQQASNKLGMWDPATQKITEYQDAYSPGKEGIEAGGSKHTVRVDASGQVWSSGLPLTRFDPKTEKFRRYENARAYDVNPDLEGNIWFTTYQTSQIGRGDAKTGEIKMWDLPTKGNPRRIVFDSKGIAWVGEFTSGKIARFDPKTETFKEYDLPGPRPTPYAMGIDAQDNVWYSSHDMDVVGKLDPKTGKVTEYPIPYPENYMKEFFLDKQGRMWFGSPPNNKVGYFFLPCGNGS